MSKRDKIKEVTTRKLCEFEVGGRVYVKKEKKKRMLLYIVIMIHIYHKHIIAAIRPDISHDFNNHCKFITTTANS